MPSYAIGTCIPMRNAAGPDCNRIDYRNGLFAFKIKASISEPATKKEKPSMSKPTYIAYVVKDAKEGSDKPGIWQRVGSVWSHQTATASML